MRTKFLLTLMALLFTLTFSASAQIDPVPHNWGYLPLYPLTGQIALRESPAAGATVLAHLSECAPIEPLNEVTTVEGVEWRRARADANKDGWMRTSKPNGAMITVAMTMPDGC